MDFLNERSGARLREELETARGEIETRLQQWQDDIHYYSLKKWLIEQRIATEQDEDIRTRLQERYAAKLQHCEDQIVNLEHQRTRYELDVQAEYDELGHLLQLISFTES